MKPLFTDSPSFVLLYRCSMLYFRIKLVACFSERGTTSSLLPGSEHPPSPAPAAMSKTTAIWIQTGPHHRGSPVTPQGRTSRATTGIQHYSDQFQSIGQHADQSGLEMIMLNQSHRRRNSITDLQSPGDPYLTGFRSRDSQDTIVPNDVMDFTSHVDRYRTLPRAARRVRVVPHFTEEFDPALTAERSTLAHIAAARIR